MVSATSGAPTSIALAAVYGVTAGAGGDVGDHGRAETGKDSRLTTAPAAPDAVGEQHEREGNAKVVGDGRDGAVTGGQTEVTRGPDAERLEGGDLAEEVAKAGAVRVEGFELVEVDHSPDLGGDENREEEQPHSKRACGGRAAVEEELERRPDHEGAEQPDQAGKL